MRRDGQSPYTIPMVFWAALVAAFWLACARELRVLWFVDALIALNVATFVLYGADKLMAVMNARRVPERALWFMAFAGAPIGALAGMNIFRHKTAKSSFHFGLAIALLLEVLVVLAVLWQRGVLPMPS